MTLNEAIDLYPTASAAVSFKGADATRWKHCGDYRHIEDVRYVVGQQSGTYRIPFVARLRDSDGNVTFYTDVITHEV